MKINLVGGGRDPRVLGEVRHYTEHLKAFHEEPTSNAMDLGIQPRVG